MIIIGYLICLKLIDSFKNNNYYQIYIINRSMIFFLDKSIASKIIYKRPKEYGNKTIWIFVSKKNKNF